MKPHKKPKFYARWTTRCYQEPQPIKGGPCIIVISRVIGSGIFAVPGAIVKEVGSIGISFLLQMFGSCSRGAVSRYHWNMDACFPDREATRSTSCIYLDRLVVW